MPRAGRPVKRLVSAVWRAPSLCKRGAMHGAGRRLGAQQVGGADLHAGGAERQGRGDAARVGDAAGGDDRHPHRAARPAAPAPTCRAGSSTSSDRKMPRWPPASSPCAMMASTPCASSQRASSTVVAEDRTFAPQRFTRASRSRRRQAEVEAHDRRAGTGSTHRRPLGAERHARRQRPRRRRRRCRSSAVVGRQRARHAASRAGVGRGRRVAEEVHVEGRVGCRADGRQLVAQRVRRQHRARAASRGRRRSTRRSRARCPATPAMGAWMMGRAMPSRLQIVMGPGGLDMPHAHLPAAALLASPRRALPELCVPCRRSRPRWREPPAWRLSGRKRVPSRLATTDFFVESDRARTLFARLVNAPDPSRIAMTVPTGCSNARPSSTACSYRRYFSEDERTGLL